MRAQDLQLRTKKAALSIIRLAKSQRRGGVSDVLAHQLVRSATSVAANYRAACRARSHRDFAYKLSLIVEEADESLFWLEMLRDSGESAESEVVPLIDEFSQLLKVFSASLRTARMNWSAQRQTNGATTRINKSTSRPVNQ